MLAERSGSVGRVLYTYYTFVDHLCYLCHVFAMLSHLFIAALWPPAGKGLTSWLLFVMFTISFCILGQVWCLIVSIPDPCCLSYFYLDWGSNGCRFDAHRWWSHCVVSLSKTLYSLLSIGSTQENPSRHD